MFRFAITICFVLVISATATAGLILQPVSATTSMGSTASSPNNVVNQKGLSGRYTSLVTDFDIFVAATTHRGNDLNHDSWHSLSGNTTGTFDFDLGGSHSIQSMALWNIGNDLGRFGVTQFNLLADDNAAFSTPVTLLSNQAANTSFGSSMTTPVEVFSFVPTHAAFVRMEVLSNSGSANFTALGEVAFETGIAAVPEPNAGLLLLAALPVWALHLRRRKALESA